MLSMDAIHFGVSSAGKKPVSKPQSNVATKQGLNGPLNGQMPKVRPQAKPGFFQQARRFMMALPMTLGLGAPAMLPMANVMAAISPQSEAIIKPLIASLDGKKYSEITDNEWNDILVGLMVTDNTLEKDFHPYRMRILRDAPSNPDIPLTVVQAAIYSAGVFGEKIDDPAIRNEISDALEPYTSKVIQDTISTDDRGTKINKRREFSTYGFGDGDFREAAQAAVGRVSAPTQIERLSEKFENAGNNPTRTRPLVENMARLDASRLPDSVSKRMGEMLYGETDKKDDKDARLQELIRTAGQYGLSITITPGAANQYETARSGEIEKVCGAPSDALKKLDAKWRKPALRCFDDNKDAMLQAAQSVKVLSQKQAAAGSDWKLDSTLPAIAQHFARKDYTVGPNTIEFDDADWFNAWALAFHVQGKDAEHAKQAKQLMKMVVASYPKVMVELIGAGLYSPDDDLVSKAGREWVKALSADMETYRELVDGLIGKKAELLWQDPKDQAIQSKFSDLRDAGRELGLSLMLGDSKGLVNTANPGKSKITLLRKMARDNDDKMQKAAYVALARLRDRDSLEFFLETAANPTADQDLRQLAMEAVQYMLTDPVIPEELVNRALEQRPIQFQLSGMDNMFQTMAVNAPEGSRQKKNVGSLEWNLTQDKRSGKWHFGNSPLLTKAVERFAHWEKQTSQLISSGNKGGRVNIPLTDREKLMKFIEVYNQELGADGQQNKTLLRNFIAENPQRAKRLMDPMLSYLRDSGKNIEMELALPMMILLRQAEYAPAAPIFAKMMRDPDQYTPKADANSLFGILDSAMAPALIKFYAAQGLGGTVDPTAPEAKQLHDILQDPYIPMQGAGVRALAQMGDRIQTQLKTATGSDKDKLEAALEQHVNALTNGIKHHQKGFYESTQSRWTQESVIGTYSRAIARLKPQAAERIAEEAKGNNNIPLWRAMANAILTENYTPDTLSEARQKPLLATFVDREYWLGETSKRPERFEAKGESLHFDAGLAQPVGPLQGKIVYPEGTNFGNPAHYDETHPTATAGSKLAIAPNLTVLSHDVWTNDSPKDTGRPPEWEVAFLKALENAIEGQMTGKTHARSSNTSMGISNGFLYNSDFKQKLADVIAASYETLGRTGVMNFISAGNEQGVGPLAEFGRIGSTNTIGVRLDKDNKVRQPDSTVMVAAADSLAKLLAEFSSTGNPVRKEDAIRMLAAPGFRDQTFDRDGNNRWRAIPSDGTSFASPHMEALYRIGIEAREKRGLPKLSPEETQKRLSNSCELLPDRENWQGGEHVNPLKFLNEILSP